MTGYKRRADRSGGRGSGGGERNAPGGCGWTRSSPSSFDNLSEPVGDGRGGKSTGGSATVSSPVLNPSAAPPTGTPAVGDTTTVGRPGRTDRSYCSAQRSSPLLVVGANVPVDSKLTQSSDLLGLHFGSFGTSSPSSRPPSPQASEFSSSSDTLSQSPSHSPSRSPSPSSSSSVLPDPSSTPGILGPAPLLCFLNSYTRPGDSGPFYKGQVKALMDVGGCELTIDFNHVLDTNVDLACTICDRQGRDSLCLSRAANMFLNENGLATDCGKISFSNLPKSLKRGRDALSSPDVPNVWPSKVYKGEKQVISSSFHGSQKYDAVIDTLLTRHFNGESFCGKLTLDDILFLEDERGLEALITREPEVSKNASADDKVLDIRGIWPMMEPFYTWDGKLPVYFAELKNDLLNATADIVEQGWFHEYLRYHPALMPSMGRRHLECELYQVLKDFNFDKNQDLSHNFYDTIEGWDWRTSARVEKVLDYRKPRTNTDKDKDAKKVVVLETEKGQNDEKDKHEMGKGLTKNNRDDEVTKEEQGEKGLDQKDIGTEDMKIEAKSQQGNIISDDVPAADSHENTLWGLLGFKRNNHQHPKTNVNDLDETELHVGDLFGACLTKWIKDLLQKCNMSGKLAGLWSSYKASKSDRRRVAPS